MIFVDTSFWIAYASRKDANHRAARSLWHAKSPSLCTSNHVLGETWTFLNRRHGHEVARKVTVALRAAPSLTIAHVAEDLEADAWRWLDKHGEREYSFVDATSFAYMRHHKINEALAFDGDFFAAGFVELRA